MGFFTDLEAVGSRVPGDALDPNRGTIGGRNDWVFSRTYKVNGTLIENYLFRILDPAIRVTDDTVTNAYLVDQRATKLDENNMTLTCVFAQIPTAWNESKYQPASFPGVLPSTLYTPYDFPFRSSTYTKTSQCRHAHQYFLGPIWSIPTLPLFQPVDSDGNRVSVISDYTSPSADEYISLVSSRGEIILESVVLPWRGDIWDLRTTYAVAK
jgi:hypothetical protein